MAANGRRVPNTDSSKSETHFSLFSFDKISHNIAQEYMKHQLLLTVLLTMLTTSRSFNVASRRVVFNDLMTIQMKMKSTTDACSEAKGLDSISTPGNNDGDNGSDNGGEARRKKKPVNSSRFRQHVNPLASRYQQVREG